MRIILSLRDPADPGRATRDPPCGRATRGLRFAKEMIRRGKAIVTLSQRRQAALKATPLVPNPDADTLQPVNWWSLLKAVFAPVEYGGPHRDEDWRLAGRPWRVLELGTLRIPVFRKLWGAPELYPQHFVRMAAYCRLIEQSEGAALRTGSSFSAATTTAAPSPTSPSTNRHSAKNSTKPPSSSRPCKPAIHT